MEDVGYLYGRLAGARNSSPLLENQVKNYLDIAKEFGKFGSIRAKLYEHISNVNQQNGDYISALVAQLRLCALIAEVFGVKGHRVEGIPSRGFGVFPFVYDELPLDATILSSPDDYVMFESDMFTESTLSSAMKKVQRLVHLSGLCSIVGDVTSYLFKFLQSRREIDSLVESCRNMADICRDLGAERPPAVEFFRIKVSDNAISAAGFHEIVAGITHPGSCRVCEKSRPPKSIEEVQKNLVQLGLLVIDTRTPLVDLPPYKFQIVKVEEIAEDIEVLKASTFIADSILAPNSGWDDVFVERTVYETALPLHHSMPFVPVVKFDRLKFTRIDYYMARLEGFSCKFKHLLESLKAVSPAEKMIERWADCPLEINTHPLLVEIARIADATPNEAIYYFVSQEHLPNGEKQDNVPQRLRELSDEIWQVITASITFIHTIQTGKAKNLPAVPSDLALLEKYAKMFRAPLPFNRGQQAPTRRRIKTTADAH
jgi:hypothetical protein